jgi:hypothetical protein
LVDIAVHGAQVRDLFAGDPRPSAGRELAQLPADTVKLPGVIQRAGPQRGLEFGAQVQQMPPQPVDGTRALSDEIVAVI